MSENTDQEKPKLDTPGTGDTDTATDTEQKPKPVIDEKRYYAMLRKAERFEKIEKERVENEALKAKQEEEQRLANEGKFEELARRHNEELERIRNESAAQIKNLQILSKLGRHFDEVFFDHAIKKLNDVEDVDAAIAEMIADDKYTRYRVDIAAPQTQHKPGPGIPASAGTRGAGLPTDDLYNRVNSNDRAVVQEALKEEARMKINGELPLDWRDKHKGK